MNAQFVHDADMPPGRQFIELLPDPPGLFHALFQKALALRHARIDTIAEPGMAFAEKFFGPGDDVVPNIAGALMSRILLMFGSFIDNPTVRPTVSESACSWTRMTLATRAR
jgi:hypothetical protein